ncbi:MAG: hypothetical protein PHT84_06260 [Candidatus Pacebacteria bacterium]|nr:hypothetical protein [Candidatus Paceibacterota bacterium]
MDEVAIKLSSDEAKQLREVIEHEIGEMRVERRRTDAEAYRRQVSERIQAFENMLNKLKSAA